MRYSILVTIFLAVVACIVMAISEISNAEEVYKSFSLGYGSLNPVAIDIKTPSPSVLTAKFGYSFTKDFLPYVGTGLAYSIPQEVRPGDTTQRIKTGMAGQAGFKYRLSEKSSLSLDYKYLYLQPDVLNGGSNATPKSLGLGLDIKF